MKTWKQWISLILCMSMLLSFVPEVSSRVYADGEEDAVIEVEPESTEEAPEETEESQPEETEEPTAPEETAEPTEPEEAEDAAEPEDADEPTEPELWDSSEAADAVSGPTSGSCGPNARWSYSNGTLTVSGSGKITDYLRHGSPWDHLSFDITKLVVEEGISHIGSHAFYDLSYLTQATLPRSLRTIGDSAFESCNRLIKVDLANGVTEIGAAAFYSCWELAECPLPSTLKTIRKSAFWHCEKLTSAILPDGFETIEEDAFYNCYSLKEVRLPSSLKSLPLRAFNGCGFASIVLPEGLETVGDYVFLECSNLKSISLPSTVREVGFGAFSDCTSLTEVHLNDTLLTLGGYAFSGCTKLRAIHIPQSVTSMGWDTFEKCTSLREVSLPSSLTEIYDEMFSECSSLETLVLPESITKIGKHAFSSCGSLTSLRIPAGVSELGEGCFSGCSSLTAIHLPGEIVRIPKNAFYSCRALAELQIPESVGYIETDAFYNCSGLKTIRFEGSCPEISENAFFGVIAKAYYSTTADGWSKEKTLDYGGNLTWQTAAFGRCGKNVSWAMDSAGTLVISGSGKMTSYEYISSAPWFSIRSQVRKIVVEEGVTAVGQYAFVGTGAASVSLADSVLSIGDSAFADCFSLKEIRFGSDLTRVESYAFYSCSSLKSLVLPESVDYIGSSAFSNCSALESVTMPQHMSILGTFAFSRCSALQKITVPQGIKELKDSTFHNCARLEEISLPDSLEVLGENVLASCSSLKSVVLPMSLKKIGTKAFDSDSSLSEVYFLGNAPAIDGEAFAYVRSSARYPANNSTWTSQNRKNYGGTLTWTSFTCGESFPHEYESGWTGDLSGHWHACKFCSTPDRVLAHTPDRDKPEKGHPIRCTVCDTVLSSVMPQLLLTAPADSLTAKTSVQLSAAVSSGRLPSLRWRMADGDSLYASVDSKGKLTAKSVTEKHIVTVIAEAADGSAEAGSISLTVHPAPSLVLIYLNDMDVTGQNLSLQLYTEGANRRLKLSSVILPEDSAQELRWTISGSYGDRLTDNGDGSCSVDVRWDMKSFTLTASSIHNSKLTAKVNVLVNNAELSQTMTHNGKQLRESDITEIYPNCKESFQLTVAHPLGKGRNVEWTLSEPNYATLSVSAKNGVETCTITPISVRGDVDLTLTGTLLADPDQKVSTKIRLKPSTSYIELSSDRWQHSYYAPDIIRVNFSDRNYVPLKASVTPENPNASGTWKSSNPKIATVDSNGLVTFRKEGDVTVTYTSYDGISASVQIFGGYPVTDITLAPNTVIYAGTKTVLKAYTNADATNQTLRWSCESFSYERYLQSDGVVNPIPSSYSSKMRVTVKALDGSGFEKTFEIPIVPPEDSELQIRIGYNTLSGTTTFEPLSTGTMQLSAMYNGSNRSTSAVWSSSSKSVASVDSNGKVTLLKNGKTVITAKYAGLTATATLVVGQSVGNVIITSPTEYFTVGQKVPLSVSYSNQNPTIPGVTWYSLNPRMATVDSSGVVTIKSTTADMLDSFQSVYIVAVAKDGSGAYAKYPLMISENAQQISLTVSGKLRLADGTQFPEGALVNGKTITVDMQQQRSFEINLYGAPFVPGEALQIKSSNPKICSVERGQFGSSFVFKPLSTGTTTFTVSQPGVKKTYTFKLKVVNYPTALRDETVSHTVQAGKKLTLKVNPVTADGTKPSDSGLTYSLRPQDALCASVSTKGILTAKKITAPRTVYVTVTSKANPSVKLTIPVKIVP